MSACARLSRIRQPPEKPERRCVIHAILHHRARAIGLKCVFVPPEAVRALLLKIGKASARLPRGDARAPTNKQRTNAHAIVDEGPSRHEWDLSLNREAHRRRRDHAEVRGLREEGERLVERRIDHRAGPQLEASLPGSFGSRPRGRDRDGRPPDNVLERRVQGRKVQRELVLSEHARVHALARQQYAGRLTEDHLERQRRQRNDGRAMKDAPERARERSIGRLLRRHAVHRSSITVIGQCHSDDLHEIVEMNPRQVLRARSDGPAHP